MSKDVTMRDIAKKLGLSAVSVSKAISGKEGVSDSVRNLILTTAAEMGYKYTSAPGTKSAHYNVGVMVSQTFISDSAFYSKLFQNIAIEFGRAGHSCTLEILSHRDERDGTLPMSVSEGHLDGIIALGPMTEACMKSVLSLETSCIFADNYAPDDNLDSVVSDNVYGSHMLTNYLVKKGHRKIAFVGTVNATNSIMDRYLGYLKGLMQNGIPVRDDYILPDRNEQGYIKDIELPKDMPEAFVCNCDEVAYHLVKQLDAHGIRVPEDVSVVGFDDYIFATVSKPPLTTFKVNMEEMSKSAVSLMIDKIKDPHGYHGRRVVSGEIIIRDSVKDRF